MAWHTPPDIPAGDDLVNLGAYAADEGYTSPPLYRSLILIATGAGTVRVGDEFTSATRGIPILAAAATPGMLTLPWVGDQGQNTLGNVNVYVPAGVALSVAWEY
jgi:hypothetical protein